jgi:hypothetical protein
MEFPYRPELVEDAGKHFDAVVAKIKAKDFRIIILPEPGICKECDLRSYCIGDGTIKEHAAAVTRKILRLEKARR